MSGDPLACSVLVVGGGGAGASAALLAQENGADFVKTSTGFGPGGATVHDVALMRATVGPHLGVKAAGGIRTYEDALAMVEAVHELSPQYHD